MAALSGWFFLIHNVSTPREFLAAGMNKNFRIPIILNSIFTQKINGKFLMEIQVHVKQYCSFC